MPNPPLVTCLKRQQSHGEGCPVKSLYHKTRSMPTTSHGSRRAFTQRCTAASDLDQETDYGEGEKKKNKAVEHFTPKTRLQIRRTFHLCAM